jgi:adenylate cyclase
LRTAVAQDERLLGLAICRLSPAGQLVPTATFDAPAPRQPPAGWLQRVLAQVDGSREHLQAGHPIAGLLPTDARPAFFLITPRSTVAGNPGGEFVAAQFDIAEIRAPFADEAVGGSRLIDRWGHILARTEPRQGAPDRPQHSDLWLQGVLREHVSNAQTLESDPQTGEGRLRSFHAVGFGGLHVLSEVPQGALQESSRHMMKRAILLGAITLCLAWVLGFYFADSLTAPIDRLHGAAKRITEGDFQVSVRPSSRDEIGDLSRAFNAMARGLQARERYREALNQVHDPEVVELLVSGKLKLGGERREATIFFADVRDFTGLAARMEPERVVEWINALFERLVTVIRAHGGIVDKYVGDAVMAVWGSPIERDDHAQQALAAALAIRHELDSLNVVFRQKGLPETRIGMGLNTGEVVAGLIGSPERGEYTVVGDTVNIASRIESLTKVHQTDLLVSRSVAQRVGSGFHLQSCGVTVVKGVAGGLEVWRVLGSARVRAIA